MKKIVRLTESDIIRLINKVIKESKNVNEQGIKPASPVSKITPCRSLLMAGNDLKNVTITALGKSDGELAVYQNGKLICTL